MQLSKGEPSVLFDGLNLAVIYFSFRWFMYLAIYSLDILNWFGVNFKVFI